MLRLIYYKQNKYFKLENKEIDKNYYFLKKSILTWLIVVNKVSISINLFIFIKFL